MALDINDINNMFVQIGQVAIGLVVGLILAGMFIFVKSEVDRLLGRRK